MVAFSICLPNNHLPHRQLAGKSGPCAAFRWAERLDLHEGIDSQLSLAVNEDGTQFTVMGNHGIVVFGNTVAEENDQYLIGYKHLDRQKEILDRKGSDYASRVR